MPQKKSVRAEPSSSDSEDEHQTQGKRGRGGEAEGVEGMETTKKEEDSGTSTCEEKSDSDSESESETESESDKPVSLATTISKPVLSQATKVSPMPSPGKNLSPSKIRRVTTTENKEKEEKSSFATGGELNVNEKMEDVKKQLFQRVWSEEDVVVLLKGAYNFSKEMGFDALKEPAKFLEYIKRDLHFDVSLSQLKDKLLRLKKKFEKHEMVKMSGKKLSAKFDDPKVYELSKKIWGKTNSVVTFGTAPTPNPSSQKAVRSEVNYRSSSDSEEETESEDHSGSEPDEPVSEKMSKLTPTKSLKRVSDVEAGKTPKRMKKDALEQPSREHSEDVKRFQRLWNDDDEVALLDGVRAFREETGGDATKDLTSFYRFIKNGFHFNVSLSQLKDKMSRLKKRFENNKKVKNFSKDHDQKIYDLSKSIWGGRDECSIPMFNPSSTGRGSMGRFSLKVDVKNHGELEVGFDRFVGMEEYVLKKGAELLDDTKKAGLSEWLRVLHVQELELFLKRNEIVRECTQVILASLSRKDD